MFLNKIKKTSIFLLALFIMPICINAYSEYVIPGGENVGIQITSKGIIVSGIYDVNGESPARDAGIKSGDIITKIDDIEVNSIDDMVQQISKSNGKVKMLLIRDGNFIPTTLNLLKDENNVYKTGLYVKDTITGIGTLSFIDPESNKFGALGHEIVDSTTGQMLEIKNGKIFDTSVTNVDRSSDGVPGAKNAEFYFEKVEGSIIENTESGIFGKYTGEIPDKKKYKVASVDEISLGDAKILTVLENQDVKEYSISIIKINKNSKSKNKNILFEITDSELLKKAGGVVQGMSGSPIIQGDYIIGAVTHVVVNSPTKGYGIFITNMLEEAES